MKYLKKFNESDVYDVFDDMIKDGNVIKHIGGVRQFYKWNRGSRSSAKNNKMF